MGNAWTTERLDLDGRKLSYRTLSSEKGAVLFCLPGGPGLDASSLEPGVLSLARYFDLVLIDPRGHGGSDPAQDGDYTLGAYAGDMSHIVRQLRGDRVAGVLGHSFGGVVAMEALGAIPNDLAFGILVSNPFHDGWRATVGAAIEALNDPQIAIEEARFDSEPRTDDSYRKMMLAYAKFYFPELGKDEAREIMNRWHYSVKPYEVAAASIFNGLDLRKTVAGIQQPCLVLGGELDPLIPPGHLRELGVALADADVAILPKAGHFPFVSEENAFQESVVRWWMNVQERTKR